MSANNQKPWLDGLLKTLRQESAHSGSVRAPEECVSILEQVIPKCGQSSQARKVVQGIGRWLLSGHTKIIAPVCPFYGLDADGIPSVGRFHADFLDGIVPYIPGATVIFAVADHEGVETTRNQSAELIRASIERLDQLVRSRGLRAMPMTDVIPNLIELEKEGADWIRAEPGFENRIMTDVLQRSRMYRLSNPSMRTDEMRERTITTAGQYVALGRIAVKNGWLICNHTTTNLSWLLQVQAPFLHNPVSIS